MKRLLILGGTAEAVRIATDLAQSLDFEVVYSLAGRTRMPALPECAVRYGGFGGIAGLRQYLLENHIDAVVDATHPYATQMAIHARTATDATETPIFKFLRPPWEEPTDERWLHAATPVEAANIVDGKFFRVFLSSGLGDITAFAYLTNTWFLLRSVERPDTPISLRQHHHVAARGPFDLKAETDLMRKWSIDALVTKNSGGTATLAKLRAARALGIPVVMIDRPPPPKGSLYTELGPMIAVIRHRLR